MIGKSYDSSTPFLRRIKSKKSKRKLIIQPANSLSRISKERETEKEVRISSIGLVDSSTQSEENYQLFMSHRKFSAPYNSSILKDPIEIRGKRLKREPSKEALAAFSIAHDERKRDKSNESPTQNQSLTMENEIRDLLEANYNTFRTGK